MCTYVRTHPPTCKCTYVNMQTHTRNNVREKGLILAGGSKKGSICHGWQGVMEFTVLRACGPDFEQGGPGQEQRKLDQDRR